MKLHVHTDYPAGLVAPGDLLLTAEGVAIEVTEVGSQRQHPTWLVFTLADGQMLTYHESERLTVKVRWP